jgi:hypothetical protein
MDYCDLFGSDVMLEMAYTQKKAERVITGLEKPINDTLLKLWTTTAVERRSEWIDELASWIDEVSEIVLRPANIRPPHIFYYKFLFFEPFGGHAEVPNLLRRLRRLYRQGFSIQVEPSPEKLVKRLQAFHRDLSSQCASKMMCDDQIRSLIDRH